MGYVTPEDVQNFGSEAVDFDGVERRGDWVGRLMPLLSQY